jgi:CBS domain-containing protein
MTVFKAKDAMRTGVISLSPDATIEAAIDLLLSHNISGAPVVDEAGQVVGIISEYQLLAVTFDAATTDCKVRDFMTRQVISVGPETLLAEVATLFVLHRIRRLPVVENGRMVGIIARRDVLRYLVEHRGFEAAWTQPSPVNAQPE